MKLCLLLEITIYLVLLLLTTDNNRKVKATLTTFPGSSSSSSSRRKGGLPSTFSPPSLHSRQRRRRRSSTSSSLRSLRGGEQETGGGSGSGSTENPEPSSTRTPPSTLNQPSTVSTSKPGSIDISIDATIKPPVTSKPTSPNPVSNTNNNMVATTNTDSAITTTTTTTGDSRWTEIRKTIFPIYEPVEVKKFLLIGSIKFFIILALTLTRDTKDTLVVTQCGAEAISFLKVSSICAAATSCQMENVNTSVVSYGSCPVSFS